MPSFFLTLYRLLSAIWQGMKDPEFRALFQLLVIMLVGGVLFYTQVEHWSFIDALYFSVITMATIGYGDLAPTTTFSKVFTMFYALVGVGIFIGLATKIGAILLEKRKRQAGKRQKSNSQSQTNADARSYQD